MELDEETYRSLGPDSMLHLGHDHRRLFCLHDDLASERRFDDVGQPARQNVEDTPHAGLCRVIREESRRHGVFIEVGRPLIRHETSRQFEPIATHAVKLGAEKAGPSFGSQHPFAHLERRLMAHVLPMAATEIRDPVSPLVLMECLNLALHTRQLGLRDICSLQQVSDPWPPLPATVGATVTVTSHPHCLHTYCSPCFICMGDLLSQGR